jgi:CMP-N,N'-diacetyllegionaminic acid synthase
LKETLFLITARGGSKGIPGKNIKMLGNKPLINYSIDLAREFVSDEYICVSTDSLEIKEVVEKKGLKVPFFRPAELASDSAGSYEVIRHALDFYTDRFKFDKVVLLQPTSPYRLKKHVEDCVKKFDDGCEMVISVKKTKANPYHLLYIEHEKGFLEKILKGNSAERRQDFPQVYEINGAVYVFNVESLKNKHIRDFSRIRYCEMPEINSVDIDELLDWKWAEFLIEKNIVQLDYE